MLRQCTGWLDLNAAQASAIRNALPSLISAARIQGEVTDDLMQEAVSDSFDFEAASMGEIGSSSSGSEDESSIVHHPKRRGRKPLNSQALNRRRFVWLNSDVITQERRAREAGPRSATAVTAAQQKKKRRISEPAGTTATKKAKGKLQCANSALCWTTKVPNSSDGRFCEHCQAWFCGNCALVPIFQQHGSICSKR